ncbi:hypothetical protein J1N35_017406 [Gossypium stocksii]|uniref:Uncharacterized protein n=1 Tax=Gossypium stocksii TaxID=47602 RepID=A0A9D3VMB6_9ROSI|nr:hypothetical protein J1N35_017406 [Gossypium stocksii]
MVSVVNIPGHCLWDVFRCIVEDWLACSNMKLAMHIKPCSTCSSQVAVMREEKELPVTATAAVNEKAKPNVKIANANAGKPDAVKKSAKTAESSNNKKSVDNDDNNDDSSKEDDEDSTKKRKAQDKLPSSMKNKSKLATAEQYPISGKKNKRSRKKAKRRWLKKQAKIVKEKLQPKELLELNNQQEERSKIGSLQHAHQGGVLKIG